MQQTWKFVEPLQIHLRKKILDDGELRKALSFLFLPIPLFHIVKHESTQKSELMILSREHGTLWKRPAIESTMMRAHISDIIKTKQP